MWDGARAGRERGAGPGLALGLINVRGSLSKNTYLSSAFILKVYFVAPTRLTRTLLCCFQFFARRGVVMNVLGLVKSWDLFPEPKG